jgi:ABC-type Fe3+/spermidine/putrescine transport system ATPase subunit
VCQRSPPYQRDVSLMFQNYALFPHKTVFDNVAFGLKYRGVNADDAKQRVKSILRLVRLPDIQERYPHELSGGQQQRWRWPALCCQSRSRSARRAAVESRPKLRVGMRIELKQIQEQSGITFIFVTHDQNEALALSDRIVVMNEDAYCKWERRAKYMSARPLASRPTLSANRISSKER